MAIEQRTRERVSRDAERDAAAVLAMARRGLDALGHRDVSMAGGLATGDPLSLPEMERVAIKTAVEQRQREFAAGRRYARQALRALGVAAPAIPSGTDGQPEWPSGVTGSIAHGGGICLAIAARQGAIEGLGVDLEPARPLESDLWSEICSPSELQWLRAGRQWEPGMLALMLFCAKEAGYKAQFPLTKAFIEFGAASTRLNPFTGSFEIVVTPDLQARLGPRHITGVVTRTRGYVVAVASA